MEDSLKEERIVPYEVPAVPESGVAKCGGMANMEGLPLTLPCTLAISLPSRFFWDSLWLSGRGVVGSDSGS
tara:strand:- start:689 stop:901 length:213 start_codon:yes stop_codon:yes gene_type:complete